LEVSGRGIIMLDMTKGNSNKLIIKFALPMILGNIFQQLYNLVDTIVVGRFVGPEALAAVGSSFAIVTFITSIIIGLSMGVGVILAQSYGSKENDKFKEISITSFIYNLATAILRAIGDSKRPLYFLIIASVINVVIDLVFVINFNLGVKGVALATIIAQGVSAILSIIYVFKNISFIKFERKDIRIKKDTLKLVANYSILTSVQQSIMNFGILIVQGLVNTFGVTVMAAFAAGVKIDSIAYMPVQDFGNAFSTYVAQNKGAGKPERIKEGVKGAIKIIIAFCFFVSTLILVFSKNIMLLFVDKGEEEVIRLGVEYISVVAIFYVLIGFLFMFYGLYRGLGMLKMSIILTIISLGSRVILSYILSATTLGANGIWWSIPIGWALADGVGFYIYRKSRTILNKK
jgi:Na+-driven multidrug efflux pump